MKVLIVEDEYELGQGIAQYLQADNYLCEVVSTIEKATQKLGAYHYDCVVLDVMLPDGSGLEILEQVLPNESGIIVISAKGSLEDKVEGLQRGADDYLAKPFHLPELAARIYAIIRRKKHNNKNTIQHNELEIDLLARTVAVHSTNIDLTKKEFDLLLYFISNKNRVLSKSTIAEHLSGDIADMFDSHDFVYAHIKNLKKKLTDAGCIWYLKTLYGTGYKWEA